MIYVLGNVSQCELTEEWQEGKWEDFVPWMLKLKEFEFDIETTVTPWWCDKKIITMQFGSDDVQWVFQWSTLSIQQKAALKQLLENKKWLKLIHNAAFECIVCLFHDIRVQNVYDTMLAEMVLQGGEHTIEYGLDDLCMRYLDVYLDKTLQKAFGDDILTTPKLYYAAQDVKHLTALRTRIKREAEVLKYDTFDLVVQLENDCVLAFSAMTHHGMPIDVPWWLALAESARPIVQAAEAKLNSWFDEEPFRAKAFELGYISNEDRLHINWNSGKQKQHLFNYAFPELPGTSKAVLKKWQSDRLKAQEPVHAWIPYYLDDDYSLLQQEMMINHRDWLILEGILTPAGVPTINWNSQPQVLPIFQTVEPRLTALNAESKERTSHPIVDDYDDYLDTTKLLSTYGEAFIYGAKDKLPKVEPDGRARTTFTQIMTTGRISSKKPNMQNIPAKEAVGNKYRNAFVPPEGWSFVSSDFISQELVEIAFLSKDPVWSEALAKGQDLHSIAAELVFKKKWKDAVQGYCTYYNPSWVSPDKEDVISPEAYETMGKPEGWKYSEGKQKCKCKGHKSMRTGCKSINFGLAYGMSEFKLAAKLGIKVPAAKQLIIEYFEAFPSIGKLLDYFGEFGVTKGYIQTIYPFYRRRWFPYWKFYTGFITAHLMRAQYHPGLGEIERASKNQPIQGTGADSMKVAVVKVYQYIYDNNLDDKVKMCMQVHDQLDTIAQDDYTHEWAKIQTKLMEDAALVSIPTGILKVETTINKRWSK